jgi:hypothetical protein
MVTSGADTAAILDLDEGPSASALHLGTRGLQALIGVTIEVHPIGDTGEAFSLLRAKLRRSEREVGWGLSRHPHGIPKIDPSSPSV